MRPASAKLMQHLAGVLDPSDDCDKPRKSKKSAPKPMDAHEPRHEQQRGVSRAMERVHKVPWQPAPKLARAKPAPPIEPPAAAPTGRAQSTHLVHVASTSTSPQPTETPQNYATPLPPQNDAKNYAPARSSTAIDQGGARRAAGPSASINIGAPGGMRAANPAAEARDHEETVAGDAARTTSEDEDEEMVLTALAAAKRAREVEAREASVAASAPEVPHAEDVDDAHLSEKERRTREKRMREEKRLGTSFGYGEAQYPTLNASVGQLFVAAKPLRNPLAARPHSSSRVGRHYQAEIPAMLSDDTQREDSRKDDDDARVGVLVLDPFAHARVPRRAT